MKNKISFSLLVSIVFLFFACSSKQKREEKYPNGNPKEVYEVVEKKDGSFLKDGYYKSWYENGQIADDGTYKDNKEDGKWVEYFETGKVKAEETFNNGQLNGSRKKYAENGQIISEENYKGGKLDGIQKYWYASGQLKTTDNCSAGKRNGKFTKWNEDGSIKIECEFEYDQNITMIGTWIYSYPENGGFDTKAVFTKDNKCIETSATNPTSTTKNETEYSCSFQNIDDYDIIVTNGTLNSKVLSMSQDEFKAQYEGNVNAPILYYKRVK